MATLTNEARHKARQIRELSRDLNTDHSVASSTGSHHGTVSDDTSTTFDPMEDGDCFMSTDLMNYHLNAQNSSQTYSQKLPELRDTAKKYNRWAPRAPDSTPPPFSINQSALDHAFPDFDSGPILSTDEFDIGRASKTKQRSPYRAPPREFSSNMDSQSHVVTVDKVAINHTPTSRLQQKTRRTSQTRSLSGLEKSARWLEQNLRPKSPSIILPEHPQLPAYSEPNSDPLVFSSPFITTPPKRVMPTKTRKVVPMPAHVTNESDNSFVSDAPSKQSYTQIRSSRKSPSPTAQGYGQQTKRSPSITTTQTHALHQTQSSPSINKIQTHSTHQTDKSPTTTQTYTAQQSKKSTSTTPSQTQHSFALPAQTGDVSRLLSGKSLSSEGVAQSKKTTKRAQSISTDQTRKKREQKDFVEEDDEEEEIDIYEKAETLQRELDSLKALRQQDMSFIGELQKDRTALEREIEILEIEKEQGFRRDSGVGSFNSNELHDDVELISKERDDLRIQLSRKTELLMKTKEDLDGNVGTLSNELNELRSQLTLKTQEHKRTRDDLRSKIDTLSYELDELRHELTQKQQDLAKAKAEVHVSVGSISKERDELQNELQKLKKTTEDLKDNIEKLISQRDEVSRVLTRKNEGLVRAYEDVHSEVEGICVERDEIRRALTRKSQELDRANKYFTTEVEDSHNELEAVRKERDELRKERDELRRERDELCKELNEARGAPRHENPESVASRQNRSVPEDTMATEISMQSDSYATVERTMERIARSSAEEHREEDNSTKERTMERIARPTSEDYDEENLEYSRSTNPGADDTIKSQKSAHSERSSYSLQSGFSQKSSHSHRSTHPQRPSLSQRSVLLQKSSALEGPRLESSAHKESTPNKISNKMSTGILKKTSAFYHQSQRRPKHIDEDMTSAFILPDIISPARDEDTKDHPALTPSARGILDEICQHHMRNCIVCARVATADPESSHKNSGKIHVSKPVPVSERMPVVEPYEDEPTLRPSVPPGVALATVIKAMKDEIEHLKMKQADVLILYNKVDTSLGMREKKRLYTQLTMATAERDSKEDQLYALYDVLEGQKAAKQEVDMSFDIDEELPWEGIEDSE